MQGTTSNVLKEIIDKQEEANTYFQSQKKALSTCLIDKGIHSYQYEPFSNLIDKVKDISVESLGGKKWASGTTTIVNSYIFDFPFYGWEDSSPKSGGWYVEDYSLTFKPSIIIFYGGSNSHSSIENKIIAIFDTNKPDCIIMVVGSSYSLHHVLFTKNIDEGIFILNEKGFKLPAFSGSGSAPAPKGFSIDWLAIG